MHEFSLATQIAQSVREYAHEQHAERIQTVRLKVGELTGVEARQLRFCFNSITRETPAADANLEIEWVPARVSCAACQYHGSPSYVSRAGSAAIPSLQCPRCRNLARSTQGHEFEIKSIELLNLKIAANVPASEP